MSTTSKCGFVAIVGRPNVGKSTLLNALIGKKISIISPKPQTTRNQILGIKTTGETQIVYIDTPGLHDAEKRAMNRYMNRLANAVILDADVIVFIIEATRFLSDDELVLKKVMDANVPVILAINKIDKLNDKKDILPLIEKYSAKYHFAHIIPISAKRKENLESLQKTLLNMMPEGPHLFPDEQITDKNERFQVGEIIREKVIRATEQELPYSTTVVVESMKEEGKLVEISAIIWVEREGQKPIVIGKNGERLKNIGTAARKDIVKLLEKKVFLRLWVKVKSDWTDDEKALGSLGFEGG
ncbi:MAG TPA: GTPase Era [Gammaproteobacteria bacterium]|nr:GTPase Era [Gammaproteobacteria bacterium]